MNRRDFLKLTAWFSVAPAAVLIAPLEVPAAPVETAGRLRHSTAVRNSMLDAIGSRVAFLAVYDADDEMIGITRIKAVEPASGGVVNLSHLGMTIQAQRPCTIGRARLLDAEEAEILSFGLNLWPSNAAIAGELVTITNLAIA